MCDLTDLLHILRARLEEYLARVCAESFTRETAIVDRVVFLINNYDLICSIYEVDTYTNPFVLVSSSVVMLQPMNVYLFYPFSFCFNSY